MLPIKVWMLFPSPAVAVGVILLLLTYRSHSRYRPVWWAMLGSSALFCLLCWAHYQSAPLYAPALGKARQPGVLRVLATMAFFKFALFPAFPTLVITALLPPQGFRVYIRMLLGVATAGVAIALASSIYAENSAYVDSYHQSLLPVSEPALRSRFQQHEADFIRLVSMFKEDKDLRYIHNDGSYDDEAIGRKRGAEYLAVLRRARLGGSFVQSGLDNGSHTIQIFPARGHRHGLSRGYVYTATAPERIIYSLDDRDADDLEYGESPYARLGHNWYLFLEKDE